MSWLQQVLDEAAAETLCVRTNCTTCGARAFNNRVWRAAQSASKMDMTARGWTERTLQYLAHELARLPVISRRDEPAVRWMIMRLYLFGGGAAFSDEYAPGFPASPAGKILLSMSEHFAARHLTTGGARMFIPDERPVDLAYRPISYLGPVDLRFHLLTTVKGAERRDLINHLLRDGDVPLPSGLGRSALQSDERGRWGQIHPLMMGGEYLPDRRGRELEIARITIQSTTQDVSSVYASQGRHRIRYRIVDEYGGETLAEPTRRTSLRPITLGELTEFFLNAWDLTGLLEMNFGDDDSRLQEALAFFQGESSFYPEFDALLRSRVKAWWAERHC